MFVGTSFTRADHSVNSTSGRGITLSLSEVELYEHACILELKATMIPIPPLDHLIRCNWI